jgi:imidazolonepropionase
MRVLFTDIASLVSPAERFGELEILENACFLVEDGYITYIGTERVPADETVSLSGQTVIPGFVDSHAHPVFAGDRAQEFAHRMMGESYGAGGINYTVGLTRVASDEELRTNLERIVGEFLASGITHFEAKSGYGLDVETEARLLSIASEYTTDVTFLGAHVVPRGEDREGYLAAVCGEMLDRALPYAKWVDVFVDRGAFSVEEARQVLTAAVGKGLKPRLHANQLENIGAIDLALEFDCASVDHCTHLSDADIQKLADSNTVVTLLPGAEFSTRSPYPDARKLVEAGITIAIATDCNPGSSYTTSMPFCIAVAVREMGLSPDQALWAATRGGAKALRINLGTLQVGSKADFVVLDVPSHIHLAYRPGVQLVSQTYVSGRKVFERN